MRTEHGCILRSEQRRHGCRAKSLLLASFYLPTQAFDILHTPGQSVLEGKHNQELAPSLPTHLRLVFHRNVTLKFGNTLNSCQCSLRVACFYL